MSHSLWQHPFVNVFRHFDLCKWKKSAKEGDVTKCMDKGVKCTVYRIAGVIPANNYIQLPKTGSQSLGLTGRYVYLAFKVIPERYFVIHLDVASADGLVIRISFSNLFKEFKSTSTWLQFPFIVTPEHETVECVTSRIGKHAEPCAAPSTTRWTLLTLDLQYMLSIYLNRTYSHVKTLRLCANTAVKGVYTSDNYYEPGMSQDAARKLGLLDRGFSALPSEMAFPLSKSDHWHEKYDLIRFPQESTKLPRSEMSAIQLGDRLPSNDRPADRKDKGGSAPALMKKSISYLNTNRGERSGAKVIHKLPKVATCELPEVGLEGMAHCDEGRGRAAGKENVCEREVHVVTTDLVPRGHRQRTGKQPAAAKGADSVRDSGDRQVSRPIQRSQKVGFSHDPEVSEVSRGVCKILQPDPILELKKVIGFGGVTMNQALWTHGGTCIVYPCHALVVAIHVSSGRQRFFIGHTAQVSCISTTRDSSILASGQTGPNCCIRIWNYKTADCVSVFKVNATSLHSLSFSETGSVLAAAGRDYQNKTLIAVWNSSQVLKGRDVSLLAKAHTEVEVVALKISPADDNRLVSCGQNNIRMWRLKDNSLRSAAVPLAEHHTMELTDICWDYESADLPGSRKKADERKIYACSKSGHIFEIDHSRMRIANVHRLLPRSKDREKQTMNSGNGISINSIYANDTFCVTGSNDGFLRVWPLDFKHVYLEAEHDGPVSVVQMSDNGLKILAGTFSGNLGVMDVTTRSYQTLMRSHTDSILHFSQDVFRRHMATVSADHTIRVWSLESAQQIYDFHSLNECPTNICYHPSKQLFAVGFDDGSVRVFDIQSTSLVADHCSHKGSVTGLVYTSDGSKMFSCAADGTLCSYDSSDDAYSVVRLLGDIVAKGSKYSPDALTVSPHGNFIAFIGPQAFTVTVVSAKTLDEAMRIDVTTVTSPVDAARGLIDTAYRVYYTPAHTNHLIVTTENSRLLKFDASSGKLIAEISNIHREPCTSLDISRSGRHLVTAGDRVLKVWDYQMRLDFNFQVFIGQSDTINKVSFTPSYNEVVSCGEGIFIWQFLGSDSDSGSSNHNNDSQQRLVEYDSSDNDADESVHGCAEHADISLSGAAPATQRSLNVSLGGVPRQTAPRPSSPQRGGLTADSALAALTPLCDRQTRVGEAADKVQKPSSAHRSPKRSYKHGYQPAPACHKHFIPSQKLSAFAQKRYVAPEKQSGLKLEACLGYNGNGRDNVIWQPETGFFAYTNGCIIVLEDLKTGQQQHLTGHVEEIATLAVQSDCQEMVSASSISGDSMSSSCQLCFWDLSTMTCRKVINEHESNIVSLAYSRDDRFLVSIGDYNERRICLWETSNCALIASTTACQAIHYVAWDPQAFNEFVTVGAGGSIMFWLVDEITENVPKLRVQEPVVPEDILSAAAKVHFTCASYACDQILYVGSNIGVISAWDTKKNTCLLHWQADKCEIGAVVARRGRLVTGSSSKKCLRLWSVSGMSEMTLPSAGSKATPDVQVEDEMSLDGFVTSIMFDETLDMGIVGTDCGTIWYVNWNEHSSVRLVTTSPATINDIQYSANGSKFVTCADDGSLRIWSLEDREQLLQFHVADQACLCAAFAPSTEPHGVFGLQTPTTHSSPGGTRMTFTFLAAGYSDGTLRVFEACKAEMVMKVQPHRVGITALMYSSSSILISGDSEGLIALTSTLTGMTIRVINDHKGALIHNISTANWLNPEDGSSYWLACSNDRRVSVWSADWSRDSCTLEDWLTFPAPIVSGESGRSLSKALSCAANTPSPSIALFSTCEKGMIVYTGYGMTKSVQFYDLFTKTVTRTISLTHHARCMDLSPAGSLIATGISERLVKIHDYSEGTFQDYIGNDDAVSLVRFSPDGRYLLSVVNRCLNLWQVLL